MRLVAGLRSDESFRQFIGLPNDCPVTCARNSPSPCAKDRRPVPPPRNEEPQLSWKDQSTALSEPNRKEPLEQLSGLQEK